MEPKLQEFERMVDLGPISPVPPHHRHQASLEHNFFLQPVVSLTAEERVEARQLLDSVVKGYITERQHTASDEYLAGTLVQAVLDYSVSDQGRDNMLRHFVLSLANNSPPGDSRHVQDVVDELRGFEYWHLEQRDPVFDRVKRYADHILHGFLMPSKIATATLALGQQI